MTFEIFGPISRWIVCVPRERFGCRFWMLAADWPRILASAMRVANQGVRFWPVGSYLIIYDPDSRPLGIVRIVRGARREARPSVGL